ncbi:hypothetical protein HNV11_22885 [Spirosoma taeanense]|uniref:DUF2158 domain-containing protein n=1 Tax=Spirosoma taeanense TaxID=2735870 RepID=A0A6M5YEI8_9BACT|nr:hypothetical protein [Spirosoma taeanense]QJW92024.1 hypothetical protein HNV11_22885 [Spirosoma taeanense]
METAQTQFQPGDHVTVLDGGPPMIVKSTKEGGRIVTCAPIQEEHGGEQDYDATKLTKLDSQQGDQK